MSLIYQGTTNLDLDGVHPRRVRRYNLTPVPLQFASLSHADQAVDHLCARGVSVEGLRPATLRWFRDGYQSFRTFLAEDARRERSFLSGHAPQQVALAEEWVGWLRARGVTHTSVRTYWRALDAVFRRLEATDGSFNPLAGLAPPRASTPMPKAITRTAAEELLHRIRNRDWTSPFERHRNLALVGLMLLAGLRRGEVLRLTVADIDLDERTIRVVRGKGRHGGKDRTAYITPQLAVILQLYVEARRRAAKTHPEMLSSTTGDRRIGEVTIRRLLRLLSREMRMRITPHVLRHTYATLLRQSGIADRVAQELLGHASLVMLQRYSRVFDGECAAAAAQLHLDF